MKMKRAFKTEILLSPEQREKVHQTIGVCRYVYNFILRLHKNHYKETVHTCQAMIFRNG